MSQPVDSGDMPPCEQINGWYEKTQQANQIPPTLQGVLNSLMEEKILFFFFV